MIHIDYICNSSLSAPLIQAMLDCPMRYMLMYVCMCVCMYDKMLLKSMALTTGQWLLLACILWHVYTWLVHCCIVMYCIYLIGWHFRKPTGSSYWHYDEACHWAQVRVLACLSFLCYSFAKILLRQLNLDSRFVKVLIAINLPFSTLKLLVRQQE